MYLDLTPADRLGSSIAPTNLRSISGQQRCPHCDLLTWPQAFRAEPGAEVGLPTVAQELEELAEDNISAAVAHPQLNKP